MKTSQNIAVVSAQLIRASLDELKFHTDEDERTLGALASIGEVAAQLEQYAKAFEPSADARPQ